MELDTGAAVSVMSSAAKDKLFPNLKPETTSVILTTYTEEKISVLGKLIVDVKYGKQHKKLPCMWSMVMGLVLVLWVEIGFQKLTSTGGWFQPLACKPLLNHKSVSN